MDREALARKCAQIEKAGWSVRDYLHDLGFISPWGTWFRLQKEELHRKDWQITDGKGGKDMGKITLDMKKRAVEIANRGGNPLEYLKECGSKNPSAAWYYIKQTLKVADPEKYKRLTNDDDDPEREPVTTCCAPSTRKGVEVPDELPKVNLSIDAEELLKATESESDSTPVCTAPVNYGGFDVRCIEKKGWGRFFYDEGHELLNWTSPDGEEVSFSPECWVTFATGILPKAMAILGISVKN